VSQGRTNVVVRTRSVRESLDLAFPFMLRLGGARYVALALGVALPLSAAALALNSMLGLAWPAVWAFAVPLAVWTQGLFTLAAGELMFERELRVAQVLKKFVRRVLPYTVALALTRLAIVLTVVMPIVPPVVWMRWLFIPEVILLEGASVFDGIARANRLAQASRGSMAELMFWLLSLFAFALVAAEALGRGTFQYTLQLSFASGSLFEDGASLYAVFGFFAAVPVAATLRFLAYVDGRARRDAWEVQIKMQRIARLETRSA
jgi:hypothetical protein